MKTNKKQWFDGWFYSKVIEPSNQELINSINSLIKKDSKVIDVGCGTGGLVFKLAEKCKKVIGIDLSSKMIQYAKKLNKNDNAHFFHTNALHLSKSINQKFDYAILSLTIHEINKKYRVKILKEIKKISKKIIIADYNVPLPNNKRAIYFRLIELLAGHNHHKNFRSFISQGGIKPLLKEAGLVIEKIFFHKNKSILITIAE